jgi:hypothetical protein
MGGTGNHHPKDYVRSLPKHLLGLFLFLICFFLDTAIHTEANIEKWSHFRENHHKNFRWTRKTIFWVVLFNVFIPYIVFENTNMYFKRREGKIGVDEDQKQKLFNPLRIFIETERDY